MSSPRKILKGIGPKLVPFFKTVAIYFALFIPVGQPSLFAAFIKCLPVISLIAFVLLHGMSLGEEYAYSRRVLLGLILSAFGDALLVWDETFIHGLGAFLVAQLFYISAFGFYPFNIYVCTVVFGIMSAGLYILIPHVNGVLTLAVPLYSIVLMTMVWRAVARVQLFDELWTWTKLCSCAGGILFAISDTCIGFNEFYAKIPYAQAIIMITYYAAQLGVSLSVVDSKASFLDALDCSVGKRSSLKISLVGGSVSACKGNKRQAHTVSADMIPSGSTFLKGFSNECSPLTEGERCATVSGCHDFSDTKSRLLSTARERDSTIS